MKGLRIVLAATAFVVTTLLSTSAGAWWGWGPGWLGDGWGGGGFSFGFGGHLGGYGRGLYHPYYGYPYWGYPYYGVPYYGYAPYARPQVSAADTTAK